MEKPRRGLSKSNAVPISEKMTSVRNPYPGLVRTGPGRHRERTDSDFDQILHNF